MNTVFVFDVLGLITTGIWVVVAVSALVIFAVALYYAKRNLLKKEGE